MTTNAILNIKYYEIKKINSEITILQVIIVCLLLQMCYYLFNVKLNFTKKHV